MILNEQSCEAKLEDRTEKLDALADVTKSLASILDLDSLLDKVVQIIHEKFKYPYVHIYLIDRVQNKIEFRTGSGRRAKKYKEQAISFDLEASRGIIPLAVRTNQVQLANDVRNNSHYLPSPVSHSQVGSELAIPLEFNHEVFGVLDVQSPKTNAFHTADIELLSALSASVSIAIRNAKLYNAEKWRRKVEEKLREVASKLAENVPLQELFQLIVKNVAEVLPCDIAALWLLDVDESGEPCLDQPVLKLVAWQVSPDLPTPNPMQITPEQAWYFSVIGQEQSLIRKDIEAISVLPDPISEAYHFSSEAAAIAAPIFNAGKTLGVLTLHHRTANRYGPEAQKITASFASYAGISIQNERLEKARAEQQRLDQELQLARQIQKTFLPETLPTIPGYDLAVDWQTARQVGGDFYDVFEVNPGHFGLVIADVSDKGLASALYMSVARTLIRAISLENIAPARILERVNHLLQLDSKKGFFVTCVYGNLNVAENTLTYCIAGHNPPLYLESAANKIHLLPRGGIALGVVENIDLQESTLHFAPGDGLVSYTDGVTEAFENGGNAYGITRYQNVLKKSLHLPASQILAAVQTDMDAFRKDAPLSDDMTQMVIKRLPSLTNEER